MGAGCGGIVLRVEAEIWGIVSGGIFMKGRSLSFSVELKVSS